MRYPNGDEIQVGDEVQLWEGCQGTVVASIDLGHYSGGYSESDWSYLKSGVLIKSDKAGLIHFIEPESTLKLLERK